MRQTARNVPRSAPYFRIASTAYWEHVGVKRQTGGRSRDIL
jgi:hypothetical protein